MKDLILGAHIYFIPEGTVIDGTPVSATAKPDTAPETNWTNFRCGSVENFQPSPSSTTLERYAPNRGKYQLRTTLSTQRKLIFNFGLQEWDERMMAMVFGSSPPSGGVFVPNSLGDDTRGWLKIQAYDQNEDEIVVIDIWCSIRIDSYQFQNGINPYTLIATSLTSDLNSGKISNLAA